MSRKNEIMEPRGTHSIVILGILRGIPEAHRDIGKLMVVGEKVVGDEWTKGGWPQGRAGCHRVEGQASSMNMRFNYGRIDNEVWPYRVRAQ